MRENEGSRCQQQCQTLGNVENVGSKEAPTLNPLPQVS